MYIMGEGKYFFYDPGDSGFVLCKTAEEARAGAQKVIDESLSSDGWVMDEDDLSAIMWGEIGVKEKAVVTVIPRPENLILDEDGLDPDGNDWADCDELWHVELEPVDEVSNDSSS